jgi:hypothetical protein
VLVRRLSSKISVFLFHTETRLIISIGRRKIDEDGWISYNAANMATAEGQQAAAHDEENPVEVAEANAGDEIVVEWARWWNDNHPGELLCHE